MEIIALIIIVAVIIAVVKSQVKKSKFSADTPHFNIVLSEVDNRTDVLIFDTETTGIKNDDEVIEIGIIDTTGKERYHGLIMPEKSISREASARFTAGLKPSSKRLVQSHLWNIIRQLRSCSQMQFLLAGII